MKRFWNYKNIKMSLIFGFLFDFCILCLFVFLCFNNVSLYSSFEVAYEDFICEELTFDRYETKKYMVGRVISYKYEIYFEEYERPFIIDTIADRELDEQALKNLKENDIIKVYYRQDSSGKYMYRICEMSKDSTMLLSLADYVKLNRNNQIAGMIIYPIFICIALFLAVILVFKLKNLHPKEKLGSIRIEYPIRENVLYIYKSTETYSLVVNNKIVDQYYGSEVFECELKGKLRIKKETLLIKVNIRQGNVSLYCNDTLLLTRFIGFD